MLAPVSILALIPARGASKGLPRKNIKPLAGKPMIVWTIEAALRSKVAARVVVSTEDDEIARVAQDAGAEVPFRRPAALATDTADSFSVAEHALKALAAAGYRPQFLLLLQPTSPLRTAADIRRAARLRESRDADAVVSVAESPVSPQWLQTIDAKGVLHPWAGGKGPSRRQDAPRTYCPNGALYLVRTKTLLRAKDFSPPGALACVMPPERSVDVDTAHDFAVAGFLLGPLR